MKQSAWLKDFQCLGDKCEDTCCKGWGMQVDEATVARYKEQAPELMDNITSGEAAHIMKRDEETDYCLKFDDGWCGIHASKGSDFLGDACHFFPRISRQLGDQVVQTASVSCPEVARLALLNPPEEPWHETENGRLPYSLANYLPTGIEAEKALTTHEAFLTAAMAEDAPVGKIIARIHAVASSMMLVDEATWPMAVEFYLKSADTRLTQPQKGEYDAMQLFHALAGLEGAAKRSSTRARLEAVLTTIKQALDVQVDAETGVIHASNQTAQNIETMQEGWQFVDEQWQPYFKRLLHTELEMALFPFSGFGETLADRITIIGVRIATLRLALQSHLFVNQTLTEEEAITITQSIARFLDHLADPTLSMGIYNETGWTKTERLWGLFD